MIRIFIAVWMLIGLFIAHSSFCQDSTAKQERKSKGLPSIPGTFLLEFGFNQPFDTPEDFDIGFWGSRTANVYYQIDKRIGKSKFSVHPGIGFGMERYKFKNGYTLALEDDLTVMIPASEKYSGPRKSMLVTNYLDIPVEIRFSTNPNDPGRSFKASVGGRFGYLFDSFAKVKYSEDGETKKIKDKQSFNLNDFRYGAFVKIGAGNFSIFGYYNLSPLFSTDKGPEGTEMSNFTVGLSLSSF